MIGADMKRSILISGVLLAAAAVLLQWLDYRHAVRSLSTEGYVIVLAIGFTALGAWVGVRLTRRRPAGPFEVNAEALASLGLSEREHEVLGLLAEGLSNKEIAGRLFVSPNTVKTHLARVYDKLDVARRTQAVQKARWLRLIP
jgi:DNA-binding CsgD family transcriptional regulator